MTERLRITHSPAGVAEVALQRPEKMNALDPAMFQALVDALQALRSHPGLRAVVLHGEGRAFCAGLDMASMGAMAQGAGLQGMSPDLLPRTHGLANTPQHITLGWRELPVPVIAAVQGVAYGGGLQIALGADLRLVAPDTRMSFMEVQWGIVPDMSGFLLTQGLVRDDHLRELVLTGRTVGADEAVALGLASRVCTDPLAEARQLAAAIASRSPSAVRAAKRLLNQAAGIGEAAAAALLMAESREQQALMGGPEQREAVQANFEKRPARFSTDL